MKWKIKKEYTLTNLKKKKAKGEITGAVTLWVGFCPKDQEGDIGKFESME